MAIAYDRTALGAAEAPTDPDAHSGAPAQLDRRRLLLGLGAAGVATAWGVGLPGAATAAPGRAPLRGEFVLRRDPLFMNVGTVGSPPRAVLTELHARNRTVAEQALSAYHVTFDDVRTQIAAGLGCDFDELFLSANTTDGMGTVLAGLDLAAGDEILTTNHEHPAVNTPLTILRDRRGVVIRRVAMPVGNTQRAEDYVALFEAAITARTKVLLFSAPIFRTGTMLPIRLLAQLAQRYGLVSIVDGAHIPGSMAYRYRELGVDFLAGSGGKWQCGPAGTGFLYLRNKILPAYNPNPLPRFWPTITSTQAYPGEGGPPARTSTDVATFDIGGWLQDHGNPSLAQIYGLATACQLWDTVGRQSIEDYSLGLSARLKQRIADRWGTAALYSPKDDPRLVSAISSFNPFANPADITDQAKSNTFVARMLEEYRITVRNTIVPVAGASTPHYPIRVSTHVFHDRHDVDRFVESAWRLSRAMA